MGATFQGNGGPRGRGMRKGKRPFNRGQRGNRMMNGEPPSLLSVPPMRPPMAGPMPLGIPGLRPPLFGPCRLPPPNRMMGPCRGPPPPGMRMFPGMRPPMMRPPPPHMRPPLPPPMMGSRNFCRGPMPLLPPNKLRQVQNGRVIKRKRPFLGNIDLTKPWVTEMIKNEFNRKDELLGMAKESQSLEDWATYREQREKCSKIYNTAKLEYIGQHPEEDFEMDEEEENSNEYDEVPCNISQTLYCDTCDRQLHSQYQYQRHMSEHRTCGIDGCTFNAHEKVVEKHIEMQHCTGLYYKIGRLSTPEDVAKWIQERKRKYPTKQNVEKRDKQRQEMLKRGEKIAKNKNRFGKSNPKFTQNRNIKKKVAGNGTAPVRMRKKPTDKKPPVKTLLIDDKSDWNGLLNPFRGTAELYSIEVEKVDSDFDDSEWAVYPVASEVKSNGALGALVAAYNSSDDSCDEIKIDVPKVIKSDDEAPTETKILKNEILYDGKSAVDSNKVVQRKRTRPVHRRNKFPNRRNGKQPQRKEEMFKDRVYKKRPTTLLERLLDNEIRHERNAILQCVRHVIKNNFFDK